MARDRGLVQSSSASPCEANRWWMSMHFFFFKWHVLPAFCVWSVQQFAASVGHYCSGRQDGRQICNCKSDFSVFYEHQVSHHFISCKVFVPTCPTTSTSPVYALAYTNVHDAASWGQNRWNSRILSRSRVTLLSFVCQQGLLVFFSHPCVWCSGLLNWLCRSVPGSLTDDMHRRLKTTLTGVNFAVLLRLFFPSEASVLPLGSCGQAGSQWLCRDSCWPHMAVLWVYVGLRHCSPHCSLTLLWASMCAYAVGHCFLHLCHHVCKLAGGQASYTLFLSFHLFGVIGVAVLEMERVLCCNLLQIPAACRYLMWKKQ